MCEGATATLAVVPNGEHSIIQRGGIRLIARHPVLVDFAMDLAQGIPADFPLQGDIAVGVHDIEKSECGRRQIGIQTEHYLDAHGQKMFKVATDQEITDFVTIFDHILDLSAHNAAAYHFLNKDFKNKISYGPYVFPKKPVQRRGGGRGLVFIGSMNRRRKDIMGHLGEGAVHLPRKTWGADVHNAFCASEAVLNIHFKDSVVTEAPRLLKAYLAGKPVVSEALAEPIEMGRHAIPLGEAHDAARLDAVFDAFDHEIARKFRFVDFLEKALA